MKEGFDWGILVVACLGLKLFLVSKLLLYDLLVGHAECLKHEVKRKAILVGKATDVATHFCVRKSFSQKYSFEELPGEILDRFSRKILSRFSPENRVMETLNHETADACSALHGPRNCSASLRVGLLK